ncbi:hypothetical protein EDC96DRAFT_454039, partial [Choanephora cucurbitarum]
VTHLHEAPDSLRHPENNPITALLDSLAGQAPPRPQYKPKVDLSKTLKFLANVPSSASTSLSSLQPKVVFLLGMAAVLRPSDLHRIDFSTCKIGLNGSLCFDVVAPKERRKGQRITKTLTPVFVTTISSWIRRLIRMSTTEPRVPLRSVAATLALENNVPLRDIVTLGNWSSSTTFKQHYRRHTMLRTDFTSVVLSPGTLPSHDEDIDEDIFADAPLDFPSETYSG